MNPTASVDVLLVDDNPRDAELAVRALRRRHFSNNIIVVKDGQEALDWLLCRGPYAERDRNQVPKVVLLDLKLPKIDGLEVLRTIRSEERTKLIPVVMLTSSREERDIIESYKLGANSYIVKPVEFDNFSAAVTEAGHYWLLVNEKPTSP
jgi:DNA-binding response OmpR family regulator